MKDFIKKLKAGFKRFAFGEDSDHPKGKIYIVTPCSRVKFEADLTVKDDFERSVMLLLNEEEIMFPE